MAEVEGFFFFFFLAKLSMAAICIEALSLVT